tara:strand:- start:1850 stop:2272 length:423 start_codon:yes stop_codon:yes gene_type:complete
MVKESILFVVSTGLLIYFVTPSDKPAIADAAPEETQKSSTQTTASSDDGWGDDETDVEEETFVFGEPLTHLDDEDDDESPVDEEKVSTGRPEQTETKPRPSHPASSSQKASGNSPEPNQEGGVNNPIIFKTNNPPDPVDD